MNYQEIYSIIRTEYPSLGDGKILKRFVSSTGREYNTYLVDAGDKYVVKGTVLKQYSVLYEYLALKILNGKFDFCPELVFSDIIPSDFLLLDYIEGTVLSDISFDLDHFQRIGQILAELHSFKVDNFGKFNEGGIDWKCYIENKIFNNLKENIIFLPDGLFDKVYRFYSNLKDLLILDSKRDSVFIHRDVYLENFIFDKNKKDIVLLDYAMAFGGRPIYDFAKFFILNLKDDSRKFNAVCRGYFGDAVIPDDFFNLLRLYLLAELSGMINFFNSKNCQHEILNLVLLLQRLVEGELV